MAGDDDSPLDPILDGSWDYQIPEKVLSDLRANAALSHATPERSIEEAYLLSCLKEIWGFSGFREGQVEAIKRVVRMESTLLMVPTGGGKSLCYQLPAHILSAPRTITLVVSPLISLMVDQLAKLPRGLNGVAIGSHQSQHEFAAAEAALATGTVQILFVSPERLVSKGFLTMLASKGIRVNFVCVDEAHCVSEWSHNFRPAYLTMCKVITDILGVKCVLALTATATRKTAKSVRLFPMLPCALFSCRSEFRFALLLEFLELKTLLFAALRCDQTCAFWCIARSRIAPRSFSSF